VRLPGQYQSLRAINFRSVCHQFKKDRFPLKTVCDDRRFSAKTAFGLLPFQLQNAAHGDLYGALVVEVAAALRRQMRNDPEVNGNCDFRMCVRPVSGALEPLSSARVWPEKPVLGPLVRRATWPAALSSGPR
jgi:hypothetical protein